MAASGRITALDFILSLRDMRIPLKSLKSDDRICTICHDDFSTHKTHNPMKLKCGQWAATLPVWQAKCKGPANTDYSIFGEQCLLKWLSLYHHEHGRNTCPMVSKYLHGPSIPSSTTFTLSTSPSISHLKETILTPESHSVDTSCLRHTPTKRSTSRALRHGSKLQLVHRRGGGGNGTVISSSAWCSSS